MAVEIAKVSDAWRERVFALANDYIASLNKGDPVEIEKACAAWEALLRESDKGIKHETTTAL